jgi:uncharacterized protein YcbX
MWARVSATYLYPIKACAPLQVTSLAFEPTGDLRGDRTWVVVDADNRITWQGAIPTLAQIIPTGTPDRLAISSAAGDSAALPPAGQGAPRTVHSWNGQRQAFDAFDGHDAGDPVAELASSIAGKPVRLVRLATTGHRPNAVHFISTTSLSTLSAEVGRETDRLRFRPNVVLSSDGDALPPFAEEEAISLVCSNAESKLVFTITGPCERCIVINVDPASSAVDGRFLKVVASHSQRRGLNAPAAFGIYARASNAGTLTTGDLIELVTS